MKARWAARRKAAGTKIAPARKKADSRLLGENGFPS
jgi:hypothetical protein